MVAGNQMEGPVQATCAALATSPTRTNTIPSLRPMNRIPLLINISSTIAVNIIDNISSILSIIHIFTHIRISIVF